MTDNNVSYDLEGDVALIGLNRPAKRNAINQDVSRQITAAARRAADEAKVGVLYGHGEHFCAGLDLVQASKPRSPEEQSRSRRGRHEGHIGFDAIARGPIPFVAALHGAVIGYGLELAACAQIRVADETAYFGLPEALRGIFVGGGGSVRIQRLIGFARMADMMLTRRIVDAEEGHRHNYCQYLVSRGEALAKAKELAATISENAPMSNWAVCSMLPRMHDMSHDDALFLEQLGAAYVFGPESLERLQAFAEKRVEAFKPKG